MLEREARMSMTQLQYTRGRYRTHRRFLADGSEAEGEEKQLWNLPLLYSTSSDPKETKLEMMAGETHTLKVCACSLRVCCLHVPIRGN